MRLRTGSSACQLFGQTYDVVGFLLSVTFACGLFIAVAHVLNQRFIAPIYDVVANLTAFGCAVAASALLGHPVPATLSAIAIVCWLVLARRTILEHRRSRADDVGEATPAA
jgi:ABC-type dipeptide/oligopeptide/nickel transport system permease subunit